MDKLLEHIIRSLYTIDEAYSKKVMQQLIDKFKQQAEDFGIEIDDNKIELYIKRFDQIKNSPQIKNKDLLKWDLDDLIQLITQTPLKGEDKPIAPPANIVYNDEDLEIHDASTEERCISLKGHDPSGRQESWCLGRGSFTNHRYSDRRGFPSYYYFIDKEKFNNAQGDTSHEDFDKSFFVISLNNQGEYEYTRRNNSPNYSGAKTWGEIESEFPILKGKNVQDKVPYLPLTDEEKLTQQYKNTRMDARDFRNAPFHIKKQYLTVTSGRNLFNDVNPSHEIDILLQYPKLMDFISVTPGIIKDIELLKVGDKLSSQQFKSALANIRDKIDLRDFFTTDSIPFAVQKIVVKYKPEIINLNRDENKIWVSDDEKFIFLLLGEQLKLKALTATNHYPKVKINQNTEKYLEKANIGDTIDLIKRVEMGMVGNLKPNTIDVEKELEALKGGGKNDEISYKQHDNKDYYSIPSLSLVATVEGGRFIKQDFNSEEIKSIFAEDILSSILHTIRTSGDFPRGTDVVATMDYIRGLSIEERTLEIHAKGNAEGVLIPSDDNQLFILPQSVVEVENATLAWYYYDHSGHHQGARWYSSNATPDVYQKYFEFLRSTNQEFTMHAVMDIMNMHTGNSPKLKFVQENPPIEDNDTYLLKYYHGDVYFLHKTDPKSSRMLSTARNNLKKANLTMSKAQEIAGDDITYTRASRGRQPGQATTPREPVTLLDQTNEDSAHFILNHHGLNLDLLPERSKNKLMSDVAIARSTYSNRGATARERIMNYRGRVTNSWTVGPSAIYLININDTTIASIVIQPGNKHYVLTPNESINLNSPRDLRTALENADIINEIKKYIIKESLYHKNKQTMKLSKLQALVKEAIKEVLAENQPQQSPVEPDQDQERETIPAPTTTPGRKTRRRKIGNPNADPNPKALGLEETEKEIINMIAKRYSAEKDA